MAYRDLRAFLHRLEAEGELARVKAGVALEYEVGAICRKTLDARGPALLFEKAGDSAFPLATDLLASRRRMALALETEPSELIREWGVRTAQPIHPTIVSTGPCKENILKGDDVDLFRFPIPVWNALDGGPFITLAIHISKDPETGEYNAAVYRSHVHDRRTLGIAAAPYRHISQHRAKALARGEPFPVAIVLGVDPSILISSVSPFPFGVDELAMAGALREEPLELVACETIPLYVPAHAEIVLECEMPPDVLHDEGPFGEFTGYYGIENRRPVLQIKAITHRHGAIHQASYEGKPPQETNVLQAVSIEGEILKYVSLPGIKAINVTEGGCGAFNAVVSIQKRFEGYGKMMGMAVLGTWGGRLMKNVTVVDEDIDPYNPTEVEWALATRVQPHRDVEIIKEVTGIHLDPSLPLHERLTGHSRTSKMIIDATRHDAKEFEIVCSPEKGAVEKVEREWAKYGIRLPGG
ncbi:MAG: UbiD family decarboxylase [Dehalococcoidia bacterium]|nr:UbiD family decarboxylase [Dehalococcoidia bacterium]